MVTGETNEVPADEIAGTEGVEMDAGKEEETEETKEEESE